jgi:hypothetical protein
MCAYSYAFNVYKVNFPIHFIHLKYIQYSLMAAVCQDGGQYIIINGIYYNSNISPADRHAFKSEDMTIFLKPK